MKFVETPLAGAYLIEMEKREDARGFFARSFCIKEFEEKGLETSFVQCNSSFSKQTGTLRGMHYQLEPHAEVKMVRCIQGALFDVILDLRPASPTFGKWYGGELTAENRRMLYVPKGFAHGFLTLEPNTEIFYFVSHYYAKEQERGIRWNDPEFQIKWPFTPTILSEKDEAHPLFNPSYHLVQS